MGNAEYELSAQQKRQLGCRTPKEHPHPCFFVSIDSKRVRGGSVGRERQAGSTF